MLEIRDLAKSFRSPDREITPVVDVPAFDIAEGEEVALHGPSGTGKTTFLNLIAGILKPDRGSLVLDGVDLARLSEARRDRFRAEKLGYVFQSFHLLQGWSAIENVALGMMFGGSVDWERAGALLEGLGLGDRMAYRPAQLSVGQQQRVAVARALANRPRLVLADEPTGNLDRHNALRALEAVREACRREGAALLLASHDPEILELFERRVELGEINRAAAPSGTLTSEIPFGGEA
jgi:putative ABC transport system ATP-binding protein